MVAAAASSGRQPELEEYNIKPDLWIPEEIKIKGAKSSRGSKNIQKVFKKLEGFVDCGATINCIHPDLAKELGLVHKDWGKTAVKGINGTRTTQTKVVSLYIEKGDKGCWHPFRILESPRTPMLLGMPWLQRTDSVIQCRDQVVQQGPRGTIEPLEEPADQQYVTTISEVNMDYAQHKRQIRQLTKGKTLTKEKIEAKIIERLKELEKLLDKAIQKDDMKEITRLKRRAANYEAPVIYAVWEKHQPDLDTTEALKQFKGTPYEKLLEEFKDVMRENQPVWIDLGASAFSLGPI